MSWTSGHPAARTLLCVGAARQHFSAQETRATHARNGCHLFPSFDLQPQRGAFVTIALWSLLANHSFRAGLVVAMQPFSKRFAATFDDGRFSELYALR